jgi:ABC-2 type transport system ATP-binding protein
LLGPNGAGKSTTVEILEGYRDRTGGEALVLGQDPQRGGLDWKARLGIVLQSSGEQGNATVREQLTHFAGLYPNPRDVGEVIAAVGLEGKASTRIKKLSGGQRRRVDVALGIIVGGRLVAFGAMDELGGADARVPIVRWVENGTAHEQRTETPGELVARLGASGEPSRLGAEAGDSWNLACVAIVTAIWLVAGIVAARLTFRWIRKDS